MNRTNRIWVIDDDPSIRWVLERALGKAGFSVESFAGAAEASERLKRDVPGAIISDVRMPGTDGLSFMRE
ncbi:MAG: response regulator, partial [Halothiobacillaceae bacterium]|nr:response regulator [Halothiobacillaceae bacterium]